MCLILLAFRADPNYPLLVAANRDEYYERPTDPAHYWPGDGQILAGRDLTLGGTWLGITATGRFAAITNYRSNLAPLETPLSRGQLTHEFLLSSLTPAAYIHSIRASRLDYAGYNLLLGDRQSLCYYNNAEDCMQSLKPGIYGLSNALLDTPWPKVSSGKRRLQALLGQDPELEALAQCVSNPLPAPDSELPDTGIGRLRERDLSAQFIVSEAYGTRATTAIRINKAGEVIFSEKSFGPGGKYLTERHYEFALSVV